MDALFEMVKHEMKGDSNLTFPIQTIHGISVSAKIYKVINKCDAKYRDKDDSDIYYKFDIEDHYHRKKEDAADYYNKTFCKINSDDDLRVMLECCVRFLKNCKIDKLTGRFITEKIDTHCYIKNTHNFARLADLFEDIPHITTVLNRCCVCHDWTRTFTSDCHHTLCLECLSQIKLVECDDCYNDDPQACCDKCCGLGEVRPCPLCRGYIIEGLDSK